MSEIIKSKPLSTEGRDRWNEIFKKKPKEPLYTVVDSTGCTRNAFTVNGKDELTEQETLNFLNHLFHEYKRRLKTGECCLSDFVNLFESDSVVFSEPCDQCFDSVTTTTWTFI